MAKNKQFRGEATVALTGSPTALALANTADHSEQRVTLVFTRIDANAVLCDSDSNTLLSLPLVTAGDAPFALSGVRPASGPLYARATADSPSIVYSVVAEN